MQEPGAAKRLAQRVALGILAASLILGLGGLAPTSAADEPAPGDVSAAPDAMAPQSVPDDETVQPTPPPYGAAYPVTLETDFARPRNALSKNPANADFSLLDDMERLIRGSYWDPNTKQLRPESQRRGNYVYIAISQMPDARRVSSVLKEAARHGVNVRVIHGVALQSAASRSLAKALTATRYAGTRTGYFKICKKGKSYACLSSLPGAVMHAKLLYVTSTYTKANKLAKGAIWTGSSNLGGRSGESTYNNGMIVYNDQKFNHQVGAMWSDMWAERNVNNDYLTYISRHKTRYGLAGASTKGYRWDYAGYGMFYSNLANVTWYVTPIYATPTNGKDPVLAMLNRVIPDDTCRIFVQHNRFKYRRIAVAQKLVELANAGCTVSAIAYKDDLASNREAQCQLWIRICKPILDVFRTSKVRIAAAWARPHDKTMLVSARMGPNVLNPEELQYSGTPGVKGAPFPSKEEGGAPVKLVQAGSASLTGSNLIVSDEITTESTDPAVYHDYLEHWHAIWKSPEKRDYPY